MLYQLPNGKVISITIEEYISLTDEDVQDLVALNLGKHPTSHWHGSAIKFPKTQVNEEDEEEPIKRYDVEFMSFEELEEQEGITGKIDVNNIPDEDDLGFTELFD
jgi:hypothetical protein